MLIIKQALVGTVVGIICLVFWSAFTYGEEGIDRITQAIHILQPRWKTNPDVSKRYTEAFYYSADETGIDPLLLVGIARRESSIDHTKNNGIDIGLLGCRKNGACMRHIPEECNPDLTSPSCQVRTGAAYLQWVKAYCIGKNIDRGVEHTSWWVWVAAYGMRKCPSEIEARKNKGARNAYRYYKKVGGTNWVE